MTTKLQPANIDQTLDYSVNTMTANTVVAGGVDLFFLANAAFQLANTGGTGSGITFTASNTTPITAEVGDQWYNVNENILYEYINSGSSNTWVDTLSPSISSSGSTSGTTRAQTMTMNIIFGG